MIEEVLDPIVAENANATRYAKEMMEFIGEQSPKFWIRFLKLVEIHVKPKSKRKTRRKAKVKKVKPFNTMQAKTWERQFMPYGRYQDNAIKLIPAEYFAKIKDKGKFELEMERYIESDWFKARLRREQEQDNDD